MKKNPVVGYAVNSTLKLKIFLKVLESFFPHKTPSFLFNKIIFLQVVCALKAALSPFSNNLIWDFFHDLFKKTYFVANTHFSSKYALSVFCDIALFF